MRWLVRPACVFAQPALMAKALKLSAERSKGMYQSGYAMPMPAYAGSPARSGAFGDYLRGVGVIAWLFMLILPYWYLQKYGDYQDLYATGFNKTMQYAAFGVAFVLQLTLGFSFLINQTFEFWRTVKGRCLGGFCLLMLATSPFSIDPVRSALYSIVTLGAMLTATWAWQMDYDRFRRVMIVAGVVILGFLTALTFRHGMGLTSVGGIQRNHFGQAALTGAICLFFCRGKFKWAGFATCLFFAMLVSSRGTILAAVLFIASYLFMKYGAGRSILTVLGMAVVGTVLLATPKIGDRMKEALVDRVARVNEAGRGIGSGMSGRWETWQKGLAAFRRSPAIGHGFRTRTDGGAGDGYISHSGYVNLLADTGLVGAVLVLGAIAYDFIQRFRTIQEIRRMSGGPKVPEQMIDTLDLNCTVCAFMVAEAMLWLVEPLYLNLGSTLSILFLLLIMAPQTVGRMTSPQMWGSMAAYWPYQRPAEGWG